MGSGRGTYSLTFKQLSAGILFTVRDFFFLLDGFFVAEGVISHCQMLTKKVPERMNEV